MNNLKIAWVFFEIADLLELQGDNPFKIRSYRQAARLLSTLDRDLGDYWKEDLLQELPGIGPALADKIQELLETGALAYLDRLRAKMPLKLRQLLSIPGVGPRTVNVIYQHLGITTLQELKAAVETQQLRHLPGLGEKSELAIKRALEGMDTIPEGVSLGDAFPLASDLAEAWARMPQVSKVVIAGKIRRREEIIREIILLLAMPLDQANTILNNFGSAPYVRKILRKDSNEIVVELGVGLRARLIAVSPLELSTKICYYTGPAEHWEALVSWARRLGLDLTPACLKDGNDHLLLKSERDLYYRLGLDFIAPELRADGDEITASAQGTLPKIISPEQVKGDLHLHTDWSDGKDSIYSMALAAQEKGYQYIAITDHSQRLKIARGLDIGRLEAQVEEIATVRKQFPNLTILTGIEVDILADGSLDLPDHVLANLDLVLAAVHSGFDQDEKTMTRRIVTALRNPYVHLLAHPSGRLIGKRPPYRADLDTILFEAGEQGKVLEINSSPERLDLDSNWAAKAKRAGVKLAINTDAHNVLRINDIKYGVSVARRAGLEASHVINTWPVRRLKEILQSIRGEI